MLYNAVFKKTNKGACPKPVVTAVELGWCAFRVEAKCDTPSQFSWGLVGLRLSSASG